MTGGIKPRKTPHPQSATRPKLITDAAYTCRLTSVAAGWHRFGVRACRYSSRRPPHVIVVSSNTMAMEAVAVAPSMAQDVNYGAELPEDGYAWRLLAGFRGELYRC